MSTRIEAHLDAGSDLPVTVGSPGPIDVRSVALAVIAVIMVVALLRWGRPVFIPITLSVALSYALMPAVQWLRRRLRIPTAWGAGLVVMAFSGGLVVGGVALQPQAINLIDLLPQVAKKLQQTVQDTALDRSSVLRKINSAADALEQAAAAGTVKAPTGPPAPPASSLGLQQYLLSGTAALLTGLGQAVVVIALTYFLLVQGHSFKRKLVKISGDSLSRRKATVQILDEIDQLIQRYLLIQVTTSAMVGLASGIAFALIGLQNAVLWGVLAAVLHLIPYVGPTLIVLSTGIVAYVQFGSFVQTAWIAASTMAITGIIGLGIVPWLTEKVGRINAVATVVALIFWDWVWGVPGLLLGIPIMMAIMAICERTEGLTAVAELLGHDADDSPLHPVNSKA